MNIKESLVCPKCRGTHFTIKREATYLYTYKLETPSTENWSEQDDALPFLFDYREQLDNKERLECEECGAQFPCNLDKDHPKIHFTILQKAIRSDYDRNPEFLG
jgi:uncharacterized protein YbaR (Trm112 family)